MDLNKEVRRTGVNVNEEETFFKMFKALYERPAYKKTLDGTDREIYSLLAERYNFFYSLEYHESCVKTSDGRFGIKYSESKLADYLGVGRNKVSFSIKKLEILGLITVERKPKKASVYIVHNIPSEVSLEALKEIEKLMTEQKQRNKKYKTTKKENMLYSEQDSKHALLRATPQDMLYLEQDTCSTQSKNMLYSEQEHALSRYSNKNKDKDTSIRTPERGSASSLDDTACPPAVTNNTNDGIQGEVATINGEGLSLPSKKDNDGLSDMMSPSGQNTIVVVTPSNTDQTNDGIKQREQSLPSGHQQPGIGNESEAAASQNLPEEKTLREWLAANCRIQWIIDAALSKLDGDQIMPRQHTNGWDAMMQQIAAALPPLKEVLLRLGKNQQDIDNVTRYIMRQPNPRPAKAITYLCCEHTWQLRVYYAVDEYLK
jgi:DNA-binding transcriptional ArsR family regulator